MHNTIGCIAGYGAYMLMRYGYERMGEKVDVVE